MGYFQTICLLLLAIGIEYVAAIPPPIPGVGKFPPETRDGPNIRLSGYVVPDLYTITLIPFFEDRNFTILGSENIVVNVTNETNNITLHIVSITIDENTVQVTDIESGSQIGIVAQSYDTNLQFYVVELEESLQPGQQYELSLNFTGTLIHPDNNGFYRDSYISSDGTTRWLAATQFESTGARRAFPSFDEPGYKARYRISLGSPEEYSAVSNMPQIGESQPISDIPGYYLDSFDETPYMSSYLVVFLVSDFVGTSNVANFTIYVQRELANDSAYALDVGPKLIDFFTEYLGIPFSLPKLDSVALPSKGGAMENWGLITYGVGNLLYNPSWNTIERMQSIIGVMAHEQAHQWFGDLVTTHWWSDIWLNEGFANFFEHFGVQGVDPEYQYDQQFLIDQIQAIFETDSLSTTRPISMDVSTPGAIESMFDGITYEKGSSIIRMLQHILTPEVFQRGLNRYLTSRSYQPATRPHLYAALDAQAHEDGTLDDNVTVADIFETWTLQSGYPLITVTRNYDDGTATVSQKRFLSDNSTDTENSLWYVPLSFTTQEELDFDTTTPREFLRKEQEITINGLPGEDQFVIFNIQQTGYYRVTYDDRNWQLISNYLNSEDGLDISVFNRAQLLDDSYDLARVGVINLTISLDIHRYLSKEVEYVPWVVASENLLGFLQLVLDGQEIYDSYRTFLIALLDAVYTDVGFDQQPNETKDKTLKRMQIFRLLNTLEQEDFSQRSLEAFEEWMSTENPDQERPISPNYRSTVYVSAVREGGTDTWDFAYQRYLNSNNDIETGNLAAALGASRNETLLNSVLEQSLINASDGGVSDFVDFFGQVARNPAVPGLALDFASNNYDRIVEVFGASVLYNCIYSIVQNVNTREGLDQVQQLVEETGLNGAFGYDIRQIESYLDWRDYNYDIIAEWINGALA